MTDILLATYNSQRYLPALLRSLQNQTVREWRVIAHDDCSTDATPSILRDFAAADSRINIIDDGLRFGSAQGNFMHLLKHSTSPYAIFCDDDDIWLENKLEALLRVMEQRDQSKPQAVWCNSYVYNDEKADIGGSATLAILSNLRDTLFANAGVQGCAILFNAALREKCLPAPEHVAMHDHLITLSAMTFGEMTYVPLHLMLYRRHATTVTGHTDSSLSERLRHFIGSGKPVLDERHLQALRDFYELHKSNMSADARTTYEQFFAYDGRSRLSNAFHALREGFSLYGHRFLLCVKILLRPLRRPGEADALNHLR